jgi:hypothetical protein
MQRRTTVVELIDNWNRVWNWYRRTTFVDFNLDFYQRRTTFVDFNLDFNDWFLRRETPALPGAHTATGDPVKTVAVNAVLLMRSKCELSTDELAVSRDIMPIVAWQADYNAVKHSGCNYSGERL